ncbi:MAG: glycoside hydrolase family 9 protein [Lachnospiraceae bacterium]|nr:glycoside hydrolase family 9 protein [Lachnospiraceae bacterium]
MKKTKHTKQSLFLQSGVAIVALTALVLLFPACNKQEDGTDAPTQAPVVTDAPTVTEEPAPTEAPKTTPTPKPTATPKPAPTATPTPDPLPDSKKNFVKNATFDESTERWGFYSESGGEGTVTAEDGKLALNITSLGTLNYAVQIYSEDIMKLEKEREYRVRYEISCTEKRSIEVMLQQNGGSYQCYSWKKLELTPQTQVLDYTFTMDSMTDDNVKFVLNCGTQGEAVPEHTIYLDNVAVSVVENTDYAKSEETYEPAIRIDQVGYQPGSVKKAVFCDLVGAQEFSVVNAETEEVVYTGEIYGEKYTKSANEINSFGDFSEVKDAGSYYVACGEVKSHVFEIEVSLYDELLDDMVRMFYLQRCGCEVVDDVFGHGACHTGIAKIYGTEETIDVSGGWHDAGDYGRYVVPAAKSVADLLYAYETAGEGAYSDDLGIPESGNGIPDLLDEVRYELEWMLKMQAENGGVYHKVSCYNFPGFVMPEKETAPLYVTPVSTTATADFCATMAMAYEFYYEIDPTFAEGCLAAAEKAWAFLEANPNLIFENPAAISTGSYEDGSDKDERYWAAAQMYRATKDAKYMTALKEMSTKNGMDWTTVGDYGNIAILTMEGVDKESSVYSKAYKAIMDQADRFAKTSASNVYGTANTSFNWGSNMTVSNYGAVLGLAYALTGEEKYFDAAEANLHYLLGCNSLDICFVTGYGTVSPQNPHHRPSIAVKRAMPGMLVGGVNTKLEDSIAKTKLKDAPLYKRYVDHKESYSTNEITIYWNSPFIYLVSLIYGK